nr:hypothetical protein [Tanacetum cinerariifolium]
APGAQVAAAEGDASEGAAGQAVKITHRPHRIHVDAVGARDVVVGRDGEALHPHLLAVEQVQAPHGLVVQAQALDAHAATVLNA